MKFHKLNTSLSGLLNLPLPSDESRGGVLTQRHSETTASFRHADVLDHSHELRGSTGLSGGNGTTTVSDMHGHFCHVRLTQNTSLFWNATLPWEATLSDTTDRFSNKNGTAGV